MVKQSPQEKKNREYFSEKLNYLITTNNKKQVDLHRDLGIPKSTLTGYVKGTSLPNPGNLQKLADYFKVLKSELDLRFKDDIPNNIHSIEEKQDIDLQTLIDNVMSGLDSNSALMYKGEPVDDLTRELVRGSVEQAAKIALSRYKDKHNEGNL